MREKIVKGWWVEGALDDDPPNPITKEPAGPRRLTRIYHSKQAAEDYAALLRASIKRPETVNIRTKTGYSKVGELALEG